VPCVFISIKQRVCFSFHAIQGRFSRWIKPRTTSRVLGTFADMARGKSELLAENALLRYQLVILRRQIKRPVYRKRDRLLLVLLARMVRTWKLAPYLVQEDDASSLASGALRCVLEAHIEGAFEKAEAFA
jgi:putative transposase